MMLVDLFGVDFEGVQWEVFEMGYYEYEYDYGYDVYGCDYGDYVS